MIVVDASLLAAFILGEPGWERLVEYVKYCYSVDHVVKEVSNAIWKYYRRGLISFEDAVRKFNALKRMIGVNLILVDERNLIDKAFEIAVGSDITVYDALYIALSVEKGMPLATLDERQRRVAVELGVRVLP